MRDSTPSLPVAMLFIVLALLFNGLIVKLALHVHPFVGVIVFLFSFYRWAIMVNNARIAAMSRPEYRGMAGRD